jgi:hypothetical protein
VEFAVRNIYKAYFECINKPAFWVPSVNLQLLVSFNDLSTRIRYSVAEELYLKIIEMTSDLA